MFNPSTMRQALQHLVALLVMENDNGYAELARCVAAGEINEEEAVIVAFYASLEKLDQKLNSMMTKLEITPA
jgi:hypothetical protein